MTSQTVNEDAGVVAIVVTSAGNTGGATFVDYATSDGSATAGQDCRAARGTLRFGLGETSKSILVPILHDLLVEGPETFTLTLSNPTDSAAPGPNTVLTITILSDDLPSVQFRTVNARVIESAREVALLVSRNVGLGTSTVAYATIDGTATAGLDYVATRGVLTFLPRELTKTIRVPVIDDAIAEPDESFSIVLSSPTGAVPGVSRVATVTIIDDDRSTARFTTTGNFVGEGAGAAAISVSRDDGEAAAISVSRDDGESAMVAYAAWWASAVPGFHFQPVYRLLSFAPGESVKTFLVPVLENDRVGGAVAVHMVLVGVPGGSALGTPNEATLTILDNDFDSKPPTVTDVATISNGQWVTGFAVTFSEAMDPTRAVAFGSHAPEITSAGADGRFNTVDDLHVAIAQAAYDPATFRLFLLPAAPLPLNMLHRIVLNPGVSPGSRGVGLTDLAGNLLDAGGIGVAGGTCVSLLPRHDHESLLVMNNELIVTIRGGGRSSM